jgi:hypothetical protein
VRIHVNFTLDIPEHYLEALRAVAEADTTAEAGWFVRGEAEDVIKTYLGDNGVNCRTIRRDGNAVSKDFHMSFTRDQS